LGFDQIRERPRDAGARSAREDPGDQRLLLVRQHDRRADRTIERPDD
jgi:hypothetical protein